MIGSALFISCALLLLAIVLAQAGRGRHDVRRSDPVLVVLIALLIVLLIAWWFSAYLGGST